MDDERSLTLNGAVTPANESAPLRFVKQPEQALAAPADARYRTLLEVSSAIAHQPNLHAVLRSVHALLSAVVPFESVAILLLAGDGHSIRVSASEVGSSGSDVAVGTELPYADTPVERAIQEQKPVYIPDMQLELLSIDVLAPLANTTRIRSGYLFPLSTPRRRLGVLSVGSVKPGEFSAEDISLLESVASHVATAMESAITVDEAESYQKQLCHERDRSRLLLEINNHLVAHLNVSDLLRTACASIRKHFAHGFAGFWIIDKGRNRLDCAVLDFPESKGFLADVPMPELRGEDLGIIRGRQAELWSRADMERLPATVLDSLSSEGIQSFVIAPLSTANGPLGVIALGSRRANHFDVEDLELLSQVGTQISLALDNALAYARLNASRNRLEEERLYLESEIRAEYNFENIVGKSSALRQVLDQIAIVAPTDSTVLLHGETGTGKELIARAIHSLSARKERTFVRLNCAAIPSGLLESELFGHEKGAFTGALALKKGRFEIADQGTLFLDEVGDIALDLQPKLLRALQEHEFERLGSTRTIHVDVRLIAATHRDLPKMIQNNQFREDLFYRLKVFPVEIPPLRERREDVSLLVHFFVSRLSRRMRKTIRSVPKDAMEALTAAPWPGNVRELENLIERAVILTQGEELRVPVHELKRTSAVRTSEAPSTFEQVERQVIIDALKAASGKVSGKQGAAERLGLKRTTLQNKMRKLGITRYSELTTEVAAPALKART
jgi:formate hydrogenlyase transcriptional activator